MRWRYVLFVVGALTLILGLTMISTLLIDFCYGSEQVLTLSAAVLITVIIGLSMTVGFRDGNTESISVREGLAIVTLSWIFMCFFGALPFFFGIESCSFTDAFFESMSGFTTTGASIISNIEILPQSILFWRGFIQWLGGMGIIVLSLAILPFLKVGGMQLFKAEVPSPVPDKLKPRIKDTALILWKVYALLTILQVVFLWVGGMGLFDAICHAFTTMPTGGFSTRNASIAHYQSAYFDTVFIIFMVLAGINFTLHYQLLKGKPLIFWRDPECRFYLILLLVLASAVSINIYVHNYESFSHSIRLGTFQVVSIITTTGFVTADYGNWPAMSQLILLMCMFIGASAGSTGGGMKCLRIMLLFKICAREVFTLIHPKSVSHIKIGARPVPEEIVRGVVGFIALYMGLFAISSILLAGLGVDFITTIGAVAASIGNIGPGFGLVGPVGNFADIPQVGKWLLSCCMLLGRLEIYTVIIILFPEYWRR